MNSKTNQRYAVTILGKFVWLRSWLAKGSPRLSPWLTQWLPVVPTLRVTLSVGFQMQSLNFRLKGPRLPTDLNTLAGLPFPALSPVLPSLAGLGALLGIYTPRLLLSPVLLLFTDPSLVSQGSLF